MQYLLRFVNKGRKMMNLNKPQKGQALLILAFGMISLIAMIALVIDGGNIYSERRHAQNAADTASLAASLEKSDDMDSKGVVLDDGDTINWETAGLNIANKNGYNNNGITNSVEITNPPGIDCSGQVNSQFTSDEYIQVVIHITVDTYFARVIGRNNLESCVVAVTHIKPPAPSQNIQGNAIVALAPHECPGVKYNGQATTTLTGGGLFVNSDCESGSMAFMSQAHHAQLVAPSLTVVGAIKDSNNSLDIGTICSNDPTCATQSLYPPTFQMPDPAKDCGDRGTNYAVIDGNTLRPATGKWASNWDISKSPKFPPSGVTYIQPGLYCIYMDNSGFNIQANDTLTGYGVTFAVMTGSVTWNGGNGISLHAPVAPSDCLPTDPRSACHYKYNGLLLFLPMTNPSPIVWNGNLSWDITGTVLAPASNITINGTEDGFSLHTAIIGYTVDLVGSAISSIVYDDSLNYYFVENPQLQLTK